MPEHSCLFWDNIQGHEEHEIHLPALCKAAAAEWLALRWRIHEEARRPKLDWYENKNISVTSNSADCKARVLAASVLHSCTNRIDVFYLIIPIFWHCSWLHVHSNKKQRGICSFARTYSKAEGQRKLIQATCLLNVSVCDCKKQPGDNALLTQRDLKNSSQVFPAGLGFSGFSGTVFACSQLNAAA